MKKSKNIFLIITSVIILIGPVIIMSILFIKNNNHKDISKTIVGKWEPYKVENNGKEISPEQYYGSCFLEYGGIMNFDSDNTFSENIGCYTESEENNSGTYKISNNTIILIFNDKSTKKAEYNNSYIKLNESSEIGVYFRKVTN